MVQSQGADRRPRHRLPLPARHEEARWAVDDSETGGFNEATQRGGVGLPPPRPADSVEGRDRSTVKQQRQVSIDRVDEQSEVAANSADLAERADRVAEVQQQAADVNEVKRSEFVRIEVIHVAIEPRHRRTEGIRRDLEAFTCALALANLLNDLWRAVLRPIEVGGVEEIDGDNLGRAPPFHLERPEAVEGADIETALACEICRKREEGECTSGVEPARCDNTRRQFDRVVPQPVANQLTQLPLVHRRKLPARQGRHVGTMRPMAGDIRVFDLAVVIPTRDRWDILRRTLDALEEQTVRGFETVVVVDGMDQRPPPDTGARLIQQPHAGPGAARNHAARLIERPLVLFLGDDMVPTPQLVSRHLAQHQKHPEPSSAVLGLVEPHPEVANTRLSRWIERSGTQFDYANIQGDDAGWGRFYSCNVSLKRSFFLEAGGFDEEFVFDYEDLDLAWRLHQHGLQLWFEPEALVHHLHAYEIEGLLRRFESRARGERLMSSKHEWFRPFFRDLALHAANQPRTQGFWPAVADHVPKALGPIRRFADERANRWYHQQAAPRFLAVWEGEPDLAELRAYLGDAFDLDLLHGHVAALDREAEAAPDEAAFYRTSNMYLYDLTAFAMTGTKRPYLNDLRRFMAPGARVLDYGCGIGTDGLRLLADGYDVSFADFANPSTEYLRWRLAQRGAEAPVYDIECDEIPGGFDAAFALDVIEHVDNPFEFLERLERLTSIVMVNLLEPEPGGTHLHRPLPIKALLDRAAGLGILRYRRYHGRSHLVIYRTTRPGRRGQARNILERRVGRYLAPAI